MGTNTALALSCLAAGRAGQRCAIGKSRSDIMADQKSCGGKSILEMIWDEMMEAYGKLKELVDLRLGQNQHEIAELRGQCLGLGTAIATIVNPYNPNVDAVREECVERWEASQKK